MQEAKKIKWNFTTYSDKDGRVYIVAYYNKWDPIKKQSRIAERRHVGRLLDDGRVNVGKKFQTDFPEYAGKDFYWADHKLIEQEAFEAEYGTASEVEKASDDWKNDIQSFGLSWACWQYAQNQAILEDLIDVFGDELGTQLMRWAVYFFQESSTMMNYEDWIENVYLPGAYPLNGRRCSEMLAKVDQLKIDQYYKRRHQRVKDRCRKNRAQLKAQNSDAYIPPMTMALDSTSISTYSHTIADAAYGHAKQDAHLKQINLTMVCDYDSGDCVYGFQSEGSINDKTTLPIILHRMKDVGFDLDDTMIVTDRGYQSMYNVQLELNLDLKFIQAITTAEDIVRQYFDRYKESFTDPAFIDPDLEIAARSVEEKWKVRSEGGDVFQKVYLHLYYDAALANDQRMSLLKNIDAVIKAKREGQTVDVTKWSRVSKYITKIEKDGAIDYARNLEAIREASRYAGCFAIRSNEVGNPFNALMIYRQRNIVETAFDQFKNEVRADRLYATNSSYLGKLFVHLLAQSLRMMMHQTARRIEAKAKELKIPNNSLTKMLSCLKGLMIERRSSGSIWVRREITKKQRDAISLLGLEQPARKVRD